MNFFKNLFGFLLNIATLLFGWTRMLIPALKRMGKFFQAVLEKIAQILGAPFRRDWFRSRKFSDPELGKFEKGKTILVRSLKKPIVFKRTYKGDPHADIHCISLESARIIFREFGSEYLPAKLVRMLSENEVFSSIGYFLNMLGFDPNLLIKYSQERALFRRVIDILLQADILEHKSELPNDPIYASVKHRDLRMLEALLDKYRMAAKIKKEMSKSRFIFSDFIEALKSIEKGYFDEWHKLKNKDLRETYSDYKAYAKLQHKFEGQDQFIRQKMAILAHIIESRDVQEEDQDVIFHYAEKYANLVDDIEAGAIESEGSEGWIATMEILKEEFEGLLEAIMEEYDYSIEDDYQEEEEEEEATPQTLEELLEILGLEFEPYMEWKTVKSAYRKLCMAHHPDLNPDDPEAAGKFRKIQNAYEKLEELHDEKFYKGDLI